MTRSMYWPMAHTSDAHVWYPSKFLVQSPGSTIAVQRWSWTCVIKTTSKAVYSALQHGTDLSAALTLGTSPQS